MWWFEITNWQSKGFDSEWKRNLRPRERSAQNKNWPTSACRHQLIAGLLSKWTGNHGWGLAGEGANY